MKSSDVLLSAVFSVAAVACSVSTESDEGALAQTHGSSIAALFQDPGDDSNAEQPPTAEPDAEEPSYQSASMADPDAEEPSNLEPGTEEQTAEELTAEEPTTEEPTTEEPNIGSQIDSTTGMIPPRYLYLTG